MKIAPGPSSRRFTPFLAALAAALLLNTAPAQAQTDDSAHPASPAADATPALRHVDPYMRVVDDKRNNTVTLELASRRFVDPTGKKPDLAVAGAVHIADASFYHSLQEYLDSHDVVLFEGVKPGGVEANDPDATDDDRAEVTRKRLRLLATLIEGHRHDHGSLPATLDALASQADDRVAWLIGAIRADAWGEPVIYSVRADQPKGNPDFDVVSNGADKKPGGDGPALDLAFSQQDPLKPDEISEGGPGLQQQLATSLGLKFQLDEMNHSNPNWRNSDMTIDQVQERLEAAGKGGGQVLNLLDGSSMSARLAGILLRFIGASPTMATLTKVMLLEMLTRADELLEAAPGMEGLSEVLLVQRNQVVLDDLDKLLATEPELKTVAIIYGAGHLPDMERRLVERFGYQPAESTWRAAITVDLKKAGISPAQADQMRSMIRGTIDRQLKSLSKPKRAAPNRTKPQTSAPPPPR